MARQPTETTLLMRSWWQSQTFVDQLLIATFAAVVTLMILATAVWAVIVEHRWLAGEWAAIQPNLVASALWAAPAWLYARWHVRRLHRNLNQLHAKVDQQNEGSGS